MSRGVCWLDGVPRAGLDSRGCGYVNPVQRQGYTLTALGTRESR